LRKLLFKISAFVLLLLFVATSIAHAQSPDAVADLAARINQERVPRGFPPYALNAQLTKAAQAHANDIASTGNYSHSGADGSTVFDRVARTGYGAYSWGRRLGENWAWYQNAATAVAEWMDSPPHRDNILHPLYREIGVGIAQSRGNTIFVIDFGAQPNVLPVFINDAVAETCALTVTLTLTSEDVMPNGDGPNTIGRATQVLVSNAPDFAGAQWQPFVQHLPWTLVPGSGAKTVYVKYRDAKGRTAAASDSIVFTAPGTPTPRPTLTMTRTPRATASPTPSPTLEPASATPTLTDTPTPAALDAPTAPEVNPAALGGFGLVVMLVVFGTVTYLARRS